MNKLYERIDFHNNTTPALNETNLNIISKAVDDIDDRVCEIAADVIQDVPILLELAQSVGPNAEKAEKAAEDAQEYAQEAATGVGANGLEYTDENILKLKRDEYVLDEVEIKSGSGNTSSWTGTKAEWEVLDKSTLEDGTQVNITDDYDVEPFDIKEIEDIISDAWSATKTYYVGDFCISGNKLYRCKVQNVGQLPTDTTYWEEVKVADLCKKNWTLLENKTHSAGTWTTFSNTSNFQNYNEIAVLVGGYATTIPKDILIKFTTGNAFVLYTRGDNSTAIYLAKNGNNIAVYCGSNLGMSTPNTFIYAR